MKPFDTSTGGFEGNCPLSTLTNAIAKIQRPPSRVVDCAKLKERFEEISGEWG